MTKPQAPVGERDVRAFAEELRKWWSFDDRQMHTHSWHSREDFIKRKLPELLAAETSAAEEWISRDDHIAAIEAIRAEYMQRLLGSEPPCAGNTLRA